MIKTYSTSSVRSIEPYEQREDDRLHPRDHGLEELNLNRNTQAQQWIVYQSEINSSNPFRKWSRSTLSRWKAPALMISSFIIGVLLALGHHLYYASLAGSIVRDSNGSNWALYSQEWILRFGLGVAFLVKAFATAVGLGYTQYVWDAVKQNSVTIGGLNAFFSAIEDPWAFRRLETWIKSPLGMMIALTAWYANISYKHQPY
jgi:hypothetical protein